MTRSSGFLVLIVIASGCFTKACGDGQIGASPRSSEGAPTPGVTAGPIPDRLNVDEPVSGVTGVPSTVQPYVYKTPADVGVTVGVGVIGAVPTDPYTGSCDIPAGTTIENKVITCTGTIKIHSNVTITNTIITNTVGPAGDPGCIYFDRGSGEESANVTIDHSDIYCPNAAKLFLGYDDAYDDHTNFTLTNSHVRGSDDWFFFKGELDGMLIQDNVFSHLFSAPSPTGQRDEHSDAFQLAEGTGNAETTGTITIRGNYFEHGWPYATKTALIFATGNFALNNLDIIFESNRVTTWGYSPFWCAWPDSCTFRYNMFSQEFEDTVGLRCNHSSCSSGTKEECCGWPMLALRSRDGVVNTIECNRYVSDGSFVPDNLWQGTVNNTDCPAYP